MAYLNRFRDARSLHTSQVLTSTSLVEMFWVELGAESCSLGRYGFTPTVVFLLLSFAKKSLLGKLEKIVFHFSNLSSQFILHDWSCYTRTLAASPVRSPASCTVYGDLSQ